MTPRTAYCILAGFLVILLLGFAVLDYLAPSGRQLSNIAGVDKVNYFDVTHSLLFDHDFNLNNEYERIKPATLEWTAIRPETGLPGSPWGIGYSVLEIPFMAFGTLVDRIAGHPADGYARFARFFYAMGNVFIGGFGLMALFTLLYRASCSWGVEEGKAVHYSLFHHLRRLLRHQHRLLHVFADLPRLHVPVRMHVSGALVEDPLHQHAS